MDSEIILHLFVKSKKKSFEQKIIHALSQLKGAYSIVLLTEDRIIAARDSYGFRPLCLGKINGSYCVASETCAFDLINSKYIRDIEPGEVLFIDKNGIRSRKLSTKTRHSFCIFEYIYFSRPDSNIFGNNVYLARKRMGRQLAGECPVEADIVVPIPDSGMYAALGYAEESRIPFEIGVIRNHYIGRTFIQPSQFVRDIGVKVKLNPVRELMHNKRIVIIEDSIVRGTTSKKRIRALREAGAKEVHMRVSCPPHRYPCFYGIDFPTKKELIANNRTMQEICKFIGLDSIGYLSIEGLLDSMPLAGNKFCTACFTGNYPLKIKGKISKHSLEKKL